MKKEYKTLDLDTGNYVTTYVRLGNRVATGRPYDLLTTPESLAEKNGMSKELERKKMEGFGDIDSGYIIIGTKFSRLIMVGGKSISADEEARRKTVSLLRRRTHYTVTNIGERINRS